MANMPWLYRYSIIQIIFFPAVRYLLWNQVAEKLAACLLNSRTTNLCDFRLIVMGLVDMTNLTCIFIHNLDAVPCLSSLKFQNKHI